MKEIYLARHGETTSNRKKTWRTQNEHLTERGEEQARQLAARVKQLPVKQIVASTASRTMKTAAIVSEVTGLPFVGEVLFYEEKSPSSIMGLFHEKTPNNPIEQYLQAALENAEDPDYRYENEENLYERKVRIDKMLRYLEEYADEQLLVIGHGNILKMLMAYIILGEDCTAAGLYHSAQRFRTANTGISKIFKESDDEPWRILIWNDHAHFAQ